MVHSWFLYSYNCPRLFISDADHNQTGEGQITHNDTLVCDKSSSKFYKQQMNSERCITFCLQSVSLFIATSLQRRLYEYFKPRRSKIFICLCRQVCLFVVPGWTNKMYHLGTSEVHGYLFQGLCRKTSKTKYIFSFGNYKSCAFSAWNSKTRQHIAAPLLKTFLKQNTTILPDENLACRAQTTNLPLPGHVLH